MKNLTGKFLDLTKRAGLFGYCLRIQIITLLFLLLSGGLLAQQQLLRGKVIDDISRVNIAQAHISLVDTDFNTITDDSGLFRIENVPVGRYIMRISHTSYRSADISVLVTSGKETVVEVPLSLGVITLEEITIENRTGMLSMDGKNEIVLDMDQTNRIPANFFDPVRMATSFPSVIAANDQANNLIVRGNSPNSVQWRLEGMTIVNPNHQTNAGTLADLPVQAGGGVNILSGQMLGSTRFTASPFDASLGNGTSVFDMNFRPGNNEKSETTMQASLIGIDIAREGPVGKGSLLANYRYSFVGILTAMGLDFGGESISFQDLAFHYNLPTDKGEFSLFGFGGVSANRFRADEDFSTWESDKDSQDIDYTGNTGAVGAKWESGISSDSKIRISAVLSSSDQDRNYRERDSFVALSKSLGGEDFSLDKTILSTRIEYTKRINSSVLNIGFLNDYHDSRIAETQYNESTGTVKSSSGSTLSGWNYQPYIQFFTNISNSFSLDAGLRYSHFTYSGSSSLEPRIRAIFNTGTGDLSLGYARNSLIQPLNVYLANPVNNSLDLTISELSNLVYSLAVNDRVNIKSEIFYQKLSDSPYLDLLGINTVNLFDEEPIFIFENTGESRNYGIEITAERRVEDGFFLLGGGSVYKSEFLHNDAWEDGRFDGGYTFSLTGGKESEVIKGNKQRVFRVSSRFLLLGGFNAYTVNQSLSEAAMTTIYDYASLYNQQLDNYMRWDLSFSWRFNKPNSSRTVGLDIQNVLGRENSFVDYFDARMGEIIRKKQLGLIPVMYYKIEF